MALVRAISQPTPASAETSPRPMSDVGAIRQVIPVRYKPKRDLELVEEAGD